MFYSPCPLTILFATETGTAAALADWALATANRMGVPARLGDMATYNTFRLSSERTLLLIAATHGEGEPPQTASDFFDFLDETDIALTGIRFGVLALGDSGYDHFCAAGKRLDRRLEELGATRVAPRRDIDVGERASARDWLADFIATTAAAATDRQGRAGWSG